MNFSFPAFVEYVAWNNGDSKMNHHWRTFHHLCSPCALEYDFITHLESSQLESPFILKKLKVDHKTYIPGKYSWSPAGRDEERWSNIPRGTAEQIYRHYYADIVLFGYSPKEIQRFSYLNKEI